MSATLKAFLLSTVLLAAPALAGESRPATASPLDDAKANEEVLKTLDRVRNATASLASDMAKLDVVTYRIVLPGSVTDEDPEKARVLWGKLREDVRGALSGAAQADARARLASLGDVSTAMGLVGIDAADDEHDTLTLSSDRQAYVKTIEGRPGRGEVGTVGYLQTGDRVSVHASTGTEGYHVAFDAQSRHLTRMDRYSVQGASIDIPNVAQSNVTGDLDLKALAADAVTAGPGAVGPRPVGFSEDGKHPKGVSAVPVRDTADVTGRTVLVYVFSNAR